jgi:uncharacterized membrane protein YdbT with pleckstrin-like domain
MEKTKSQDFGLFGNEISKTRIIRPSPIGSYIQIIIVALLLSFFAYELKTITADWMNFIIAIWIIAIIAGIAAWISHKFKSISVCDDALTVRTGVITSKTTLIPYGTITDVNVKQNIFSKLLGLGLLDINTAGTTQVEVTMADLKCSDLTELLGIIKSKSKAKIA